MAYEGARTNGLGWKVLATACSIILFALLAFFGKEIWHTKVEHGKDIQALRRDLEKVMQSEANTMRRLDTMSQRILTINRRLDAVGIKPFGWREQIGGEE